MISFFILVASRSTGLSRISLLIST
jgi:hypothetical protein